MGSVYANLGVPAFLLLLVTFAAEIGMLFRLEGRVQALRSDVYSDFAFQDTRETVRELDRYSRGLGSVFGIGASFVVVLFLANFLTAAAVAAQPATASVDLAGIIRFLGYGVVALFLFMFATTVWTTLRTTMKASRQLRGAAVKGVQDGASLLGMASSIHRRFLAYACLYALLLIPLLAVLR